MALRLPTLRDDQRAILAHPAQTKVIAMGRRWGKTFMSGAYALSCANRGGAVAWVVPTYKNARAPWRFAEQLTAGIRDRIRVNRTERLMEFPSGGRLSVYSADNDVALRGEAFDVVIVDEAAMVGEETFTDVLLPTLADRDGRILLISTPKGRNWFWREWMRGAAGAEGVACFTAPTSDNPNPRIQKAAALARERVSERTYRQEWLAEFVEDGGGVFRGVRAASTASPAPLNPAHTYVIGADWARSGDYTVFCVIDATERRQVALDRFTDVEYTQQIGRFLALWGRYGRPRVYSEANSIGGPIWEALVREGVEGEALTTTNASKAAWVDALALALERQDVTLLDDPAQVAELEAFETVRLPSGAVRYGAPAGMHDDTVMALCLAWHGASAEPAHTYALTYLDAPRVGARRRQR